MSAPKLSSSVPRTPAPLARTLSFVLFALCLLNTDVLSATRPQDGAPRMEPAMAEGQPDDVETDPAASRDDQDPEPRPPAPAPSLPVPANAVRSAADIDVALAATWAQAALEPAPLAAPEVWLRRVWLDLTGEIPPPEAVRAFAQEAAAATRSATPAPGGVTQVSPPPLTAAATAGAAPSPAAPGSAHAAPGSANANPGSANANPGSAHAAGVQGPTAASGAAAAAPGDRAGASSAAAGVGRTGQAGGSATRAAGAPDPLAGAKARVVARLLGGKEWAAHWGRVLGRALVAPRAEPDRQVGAALEKAVAERLAAGASWPSIARALVVGGGAGDGSAAFRSQFAEAPYEIAGQLGSAVFGMRLRCAQCHDDPLQGWKVADYYGLAAFFGSPRRLSVPAKLYENWKAGKVRNFYELVMNVPEMRPRGSDHRWVRKEIEGYAAELRQLSRMGFGNQPVPEVSGLDWAAYDVYRIHAARRAANKDGGFGRRTNILSDRDGGELIMPPLPASPLAADHAPPAGKPVQPRWPNDPARPAPAIGSRRAALAAHVGDPANPLVARAITNRVWYELMGHGLVEPVDEIVRPTSTHHAALLDRLASGLTGHRGDLKWLLATITTSRAYGLACAPTSTAAVPLPSRPLTRPHYGLEIEMGARLIPDAPILRETARRDAPSTEPLPDIRPAGKPLAPSPAPSSTPRLSAPERGAIVPVPPVAAAPAPAPSAQAAAQAVASPAPGAATSGGSATVSPGAAAADAAIPADPEVLFAVRLARPLDAVEVEAALRKATGRGAASVELTKALARSFDPEGGESESGMRRGGLGRGLFLLTGPELQRVVDEAPLLGELGKMAGPEQALDELFVRTLGRSPDEGERVRLAAALGKVPSGVAARRPWADMLWALVSSAEFLSNH